jgi:hypothetical protein
MDKIYDTIIWGASLAGLEKALELKEKGQEVLVVNKFGFPGGNITEALSCLMDEKDFEGSSLRKRLRSRVSELNFGVINSNNNELILHPETVKRAAWEEITFSNLPVIFHLTPLQIDRGKETSSLRVFGRKGTFTLNARALLDYSDNRFLSGLEEQSGYQDQIRINCFFKDMNRDMEEHFGFRRVVETSVGYYAVYQKKGVPWGDIEKHFNKSLDELAVEGWKQYGIRMLIMPVYPELVFNKNGDK